MLGHIMIREIAVRPILIALLSSALALAGCVKKTQDIQASYVNANKYDPLLCSQLRGEATRVSQRAAFFLAEPGKPGGIVEQGDTVDLFERPRDPRTSDYVNGRFG